jgi:hypothetical protein
VDGVPPERRALVPQLCGFAEWADGIVMHPDTIEEPHL